MSHPWSPGVQVNQGNDCRIAAGNYYEIHVTEPRDDLIAQGNPDQLDASECADERQFFRRFWVNATPPARVQMIELKRRYQLTDHDLRWLRLTGHLRVSRHGTSLARSKLGPVIGWFFAMALCFYCFLGLVVIGISSAPAWKQSMGMIVVSTLCICGAWAIDKVFVAPERCLKEAGL